jgi:hypothetical protein
MTNRAKFWISAAVYALNVVAFCLSLFVFSIKDIAGAFFLIFFVYTICMHIELEKDGGRTIALRGGWKLVSSISDLLAFALFLYCVLLTREGRGIEVEGAYWIRQGNELIRQISVDEYRRLVFAETRLQIGFMLAFTVRPFVTYGELRNIARCK